MKLVLNKVRSAPAPSTSGPSRKVLPTSFIAPSIKRQLNPLVAAFAKQLCFADKKSSAVYTQMSFLFEAAAPRAAYLGAPSNRRQRPHPHPLPHPKGIGYYPWDHLPFGRPSRLSFAASSAFDSGVVLFAPKFLVSCGWLLVLPMRVLVFLLVRTRF